MLRQSAKFIQQCWEDMLFLFFPEVCAACERSLVSHEQILCTTCKFKLPRTGFHNWDDNFMMKHFWGRVDLKAAYSFLYFSKETKVQRLLHLLKYKGRPEIGNYIGDLYGSELKNDGAVDHIDFIIPVPLHPTKEEARGYNQALKFAEGISEATGIPVRHDFLVRGTISETQAKKSRFERWRNVKDKFFSKNENKWRGKNILLVDDVMTTGSTLEACCRGLLDKCEVNITVATIAVAIH
ncbi:MAG TPA: hypothetical protein DCQ93_05670 [Bacteroidetes bacterium]|nr:hypothetical protein [Bacteroidota bacterium]